MIQYNKVYEENKELDILFDEKHPQMNDRIFKKNVLELLVELGELANETRCFKYWSIKGPSAKEDILDEYADCILMILMFCNLSNISLDEEFEMPTEHGIDEHFIYLYGLCSNIIDNFNKDYVKKILVNLIYLGKLLNFSDEDIINGSLHKINKNKQRLIVDFVH